MVDIDILAAVMSTFNKPVLFWQLLLVLMVWHIGIDFVSATRRAVFRIIAARRGEAENDG